MSTRRAAPLPHQAWCTALALVAIILLLQAGGESVHAHWRYERLAVLNEGEWWRLVSAHFVHLGWNHAVLNAFGVVFCCAIDPELFCLRMLVLRTMVLGLLVALMLLAFSPTVSHYAGLSGVLYGLLVLCWWPRFQRSERMAGVALLSVCGWALWQWLLGPSADEERLIGGRIIADAHLYGLLGAALKLTLFSRTPDRSGEAPSNSRASQ